HVCVLLALAQPPTTPSPLPLHDALPISMRDTAQPEAPPATPNDAIHATAAPVRFARSGNETRAVIGARGGDSRWVAEPGSRCPASTGRRGETAGFPVARRS